MSNIIMIHGSHLLLQLQRHLAQLGGGHGDGAGRGPAPGHGQARPRPRPDLAAGAHLAHEMELNVNLETCQ